MSEETTEEIEIASGLIWERPHYYLEDKLFVPHIFDAVACGEKVPSGFNSVKVVLEAGMRSSLNWQDSLEIAQAYLEQGLFILWELDLGLFSQLTQPLSDKGQFLALQLGVNHFFEKIWPLFRDKSLGITLYRGTADFTQIFPWDSVQQANLREWLSAESKETMTEKQLTDVFCRNVLAEYLTLLMEGQPDDLPTFLVLDTTSLDASLATAQLLRRDCFERFSMITKANRLSLGDLSWGSPFQVSQGFLSRSLSSSPVLVRPNIGLCLPASYAPSQDLEEALQFLIQQNRPFRILTETYLTTEWDGLDAIIVAFQALSIESKRKLQGFSAAGGRVVAVDTESWKESLALQGLD